MELLNHIKSVYLFLKILHIVIKLKDYVHLSQSVYVHLIWKFVLFEHF